MKYEDYKIEDLVFLTKKDWTEEEMKEVLDTFPESNQTEQIREALNNVIEAIDNEIIKTDRWGKINKQSARAYANKHDHIMYNNSSWNKGLYIYIDGDKHYMPYKSDAKRIIEYLDDINKRFDCICYRYIESETRYKREKETNEYEATNRERIIANIIADCYLNKFEIRILKSFQNYRYSDGEIPSYRAEDKTVRGSYYTRHNKYGEIEFYDKVVSKEDAEKIIEIMIEANRKAEMIMDRVDIELREIREKYKD